jgi:hypothetical protein
MAPNHFTPAMKGLFLAFGTAVLLPATILAQQPEERLNRKGEVDPIEKVYLHLDRDDYVAGQTLWLKAYLYSDFLPSDRSTVLFVDLINTSASQVAKLSLPIFRAVSQGQIELPDTLTSGNYILRAYTPTMLNNSAEFIYTRSLAIAGKDKKSPPATASSNTRLEFFPEGGNFVAGQPNTIAIKSTNNEGWPVNVKGVVKNNKHEVVSEYSTLHDGMGMVDIDVQLNGGYYVELENDPLKQKYFLPAVGERGIVFRLLNAPDGIHFEILQKKDDPIFQGAYMIGQMQHHVVFKQPLKVGAATLTGIINTNKLSSGILHITVFNKDGMPLAERLSFVNNKEYIREGQLTTDTLGLLPHAKNHFTLAFKDSVTGSFSVTITDPVYNAATTRDENIYSRLLLTSDLKGYIHNPAYYFSNNSDSVKYALDLLMMTNGWRRFKWEELLKESTPLLKYKDPAFVTLSGRVLLEGTRKPFAEKDLLMFMVGADSSKTMQLIRTDANGNYRADSLIFFGKTNILFSDIKGKKSKFVDIRPDGDSLHRSYILPGIALNNLIPTGDKPGNNNIVNQRLLEQYDEFQKAYGITLSEVVVTAKKKTPLEELEEKYASGAFSGGETRRTFDLLNTDDAKSYLNIFDYLQIRVPGLVAARTQDGDYQVFYRQMPTISSLGNQQMDIFLDEVLTDANTVAYIHPNQIAMIKVYSSFVGSTGGGAGGAIAIYLKKGTDYFSSLPMAGEMIVYNGFSVIREFYSPNYTTPVKSTKPDQRMTIYWKPDIFVNAKDVKLPIRFFNNDRTKAFKVVVEGMTTDGKMLMIEQTYPAKPF